MGMPVLLLGAAPGETALLKDFFSKEGKTIFELIRNPPSIRQSGFDLTTLDQPKLWKGECWQVANGDRKYLRVYEDGTALFRANADSSFLGWGQDPDKFFTSPRLNPVALVEVMYLFVVLVREIGCFFATPPKTIQFQVALRNAWFEGKKLFLPPGGVDSWHYRFGKDNQEAHCQDINIEKLWSYSEVKEKSEYVAFELIQRLYGMFGHPAEAIPYVSQDQTGKRFIDKEKILKLR